MLIHEVAMRLGISKRTIRHYEQIGLIEVEVNEDNGYRIYTEMQLQQLQQIVYYRSLNIGLKDIMQLLKASDEQKKQYLRQHLQTLQEEQYHLTNVISQLEKTIKAMEENNMSEKFEQQKQQWIQQNEEQYGEEIRECHGEQSVMASYGKLKDMTEAQYEAAQQLEQTLFERLAEAMAEDSNELYLEIAELHKRWLSFYWPKYTKQAHVGLAQMYVLDERFTAYYDKKVGDGATQLLFDAIKQYSQQ